MNERLKLFKVQKSIKVCMSLNHRRRVKITRKLQENDIVLHV